MTTATAPGGLKGPGNAEDLISDQAVLYKGWDFDAGNARRYYVNGIISFMRNFPGKRITFLKDDGFIDRAVSVIANLTTWPNQLSFVWSEPNAANQLRRIMARQPVAFLKAAQTIVACQCALDALLPALPSDWAFSHMAVVPAVSNIDNLTRTAIDGVRGKPNWLANLATHSKQTDPLSILEEMLGGACVTRPTAEGLAQGFQLLNDPSITIGAVRHKPGRFLGRGDATEKEVVDIS